MNLGPSLHRADFFGLHSHQADDGKAQHSCCCCHSHSDCDPDDSEESFSSNADHDCAFCKFFDQFHVAVSVIELAEADDFASSLSTCDPDKADKAHFAATARGPPIS